MMSFHDPTHSDSTPDSSLPQVFQRHVARWAERFNRGDGDALDELYEDAGILVPVPGHPVGGSERSGANAHLMRQGVPIEAQLRRCYVAGDLALLIIDWSLSGAGPDARELAMSGTATDVLRRGTDGQWRIVIDNPSGTS